MTSGDDRATPESHPPAARRATHRPVTDDDGLDEATAISARRAEPAHDVTELSVRRNAPLDDGTRLSTRRAVRTNAATVSAVEPLEPVEDATALSVRRGGPSGASAVGPRRSAAPDAGGVTESAAPSLAEPETVVDDTILRPPHPSAGQPAAGDEPAFDAAQQHRAAYVPTAAELADRRAPRAPEVVVASRTHAPSPRSLEGAGDDAPTSAPRRPRRLGARGGLLMIAGAVFIVVVLTAVALTLLPA